MSRTKFIGRSVTRLEDPPLVAGKGCFAADVSFAGQWHMRVVRSPIAHGLIKGINTSAALEFPGVHAIWTAADVRQIPPIGFRLTSSASHEPYKQPILARERVRYVGEPIAAVFASDAYLAEDAADLVSIDIDPLPVVLSATDEPASFDEQRTTEPDTVVKSIGDIAAAFKAAGHLIELELSVGRHTAVPLETRGAIATYDVERDLLEMHGAAKVTHWNRDQIAMMLGRRADSVHLREGHVGGGFGVRGELYPEDVLVCAAALAFKRPVKWVEDRREHLIAANHSRQQHHRIKAAVDSEGHILGIDDEFFHDNGAYLRTHAATVPDLAATMLPGPYRVPAYRARGHIRLTNKTPCGTYRSPGRFESTFVRERLFDAIAARVGIDRIEVRRRNLISSAEMPYELGLSTLGTPVVYDSGDYAALIDKSLQASAWKRMQSECEKRRATGEKVGLGFAMFVEKSGLGPFDKVRIELSRDGDIEVVTGTASLGQGLETAMAQVCADTLGVDYASIRVTHGDTERIDKGMGAFASRATVMCGEATRMAAEKLRRLVLTAAAPMMGGVADELEIVSGVVVRKGHTESSVSLKSLAAAQPKGFSAEAEFKSTHMVYPYGVHIAQVKVDTATGAVSIERYFVGYDVGRAVNPALVEGQIVGGVAQGIGGSLFEEFLYSDEGQPLAVTFADYLIPTSREIPRIDVVITEDAPSPLNQLGLKGAGEGGANAVGAAIASALDDALQRPGLVSALPITPQRLRNLLAGTF
jgi:CO/xanthine dehydrogenase Mo-binding subunit